MKRLLLFTLVLIGGYTMAQGIYVNDAGELREIRRVFVNDAGVLREIHSAYVNDAGVLRQYFSSGTVTLSGATIEHSIPGPTGGATARIEFRTDGTVWKTEGTTETQLSASTDWVRPADGAAAYQIRFTGLAGDDPSNSTVAEDVWHSFSDGEFHIQYFRPVSGFVSGTFDIEIRLGPSGTAVSAEYSMRAEKA